MRRSVEWAGALRRPAPPRTTAARRRSRRWRGATVFTPDMLFKWRCRYCTSANTGAGFVPVVVKAPEPAGEVAPGCMEIVLGGKVWVVVDATVRAPAVARMLAVVAGR